jgi:hypothetical protein
MIHRPSFFPFVGIVLGIVLAYSLEVGLMETWHSLGKPAEPISQIIGANETEVYVLSNSGKVYSFSYYQWGKTRKNDWVEVVQNDYKIVPESLTGYFISLPPLFQMEIAGFSPGWVLTRNSMDL